MEDNKGKKSLRVISVTGGKGGIGKTTISVNLAISFAKAKKKVLLFDADLGLANVDLMLGIKPDKTIQHFLSGSCSLKDICVEGPYGLKIIPSASGIQETVDLTPQESMHIVQSFETLTDDFDVMIVDMASGISNQVISMTHASKEILVVICNEPSSLVDSYAVIKILNQKYARSRFGIIVNKVNTADEGYSVFAKFQETASRFMNLSMNYLGHVPNDDYVGIAARERKALVDHFPRSRAAQAFGNICSAVERWSDDSCLAGGIHFFFERLIQHQPVE